MTIPKSLHIPRMARAKAARDTCERAYGRDTCERAYAMHLRGNGASTIGFDLGLTTRQADAAINAGRALAGAA